MLRRTLLRTRLGQGRPVWSDTPWFRIEDHVVLVQPERAFANEHQFLAWCARRSTIPLDRSRPLFSLTEMIGNDWAEAVARYREPNDHSPDDLPMSGDLSLC